MLDLYSVALWASPMPRPISFAVHTWFVVSYQGNQDRYEVWDPASSNTNGVLCINIAPPDRGCRTHIFSDPLQSQQTFTSLQLAEVTGPAGSAAAALYNFIVHNSPAYPHKGRYVMYPGPNSNTYTQWVLNQFADSELRLPWNAFGKGY